MSFLQSFYKFLPYNFRNIIETPWAGQQIAKIKKRYFPTYRHLIPALIGESWEISTDDKLPTKLLLPDKSILNFSDLLNTYPQYILGNNIFNRYDKALPLLLKWIEAQDSLSVQIHPTNTNKLLNINECGKTEAWLVLNTQADAFVYLGFAKNLSPSQILSYLQAGQVEQCLYKYRPKLFDFIFIPPGCVHALGAGVLVAEVQYVLPQKNPQTWRIFDWQRRYDAQGQLSTRGTQRSLHLAQACTAIDWNLDYGAKLAQSLVQNMARNNKFYGNNENPFAIEVFSQVSAQITVYEYEHLIANSISLFTVYSGFVTLIADTEVLQLCGGESGVISAATARVKIYLHSKDAVIIFFGLNDLRAC